MLVVAADSVGSRMAGPAIRSLNIARELVRQDFEVTLAAPNEIDSPLESVSIARIGVHDARRTIALARAHDAVIAQRLPTAAMVFLAGSETRVVYDLYAPPLHEAIAAGRGRARQDRARLIVETALLTGDAFICASERQRDLWLGALAVLGRLNGDDHPRDSSYRHLIDVVPFGIEAEPARSDGHALRGMFPAVGEDSRVLIWAGGVWNWLDPLTVIRAVHQLSQERADIRLVFMGLRRPNPRAAETTMADRAVTLARQLGVEGSTVLFNDGWVPYDRRGAWLCEADIGVSAHFDSLETRFAFRTRLLDYLWAGLPIVTTRGDVLGDLVEQERLGASLPAGDVGAWVAALRGLLDDAENRRAMAERAAGLRQRFEWERVVEPLVGLLSEPGHRLALRRRAGLAMLRDVYLSGRILVAQRDARES